MTMKTINIYLITLLFGLMCLQGCGEDDLDLKPISAIGDNAFYSNTDEVEGGVLAIYDGLQEVPLREFALTEMRSDNTRTKSREGDWAQFESLNVQPTNNVVGDYWAANYNVIFRANTVLRHLDAVDNDALRDQFEGEAKFTRALANFNLVRAYGDVPLVDKVIKPEDESYFDRDAAADVLAFIANDLEDAVSMLPSRGAVDEGRATNGAARALLAKVHLTLNNYAAAETRLAELIADGSYALQDEYHDVFYNERNTEIIFAIQYMDDDTQESQDFSFEMTNNGTVSGLNYITDEFAAFVDVNDTERAAVFFSPDNTDEVGKFLTESTDIRLCGNDWIVLRLADVFLMHAEAIMAGNASTQDLDALASYNAIRERVGLSTLPLDGSATLTKQMLLDERRAELAFENHRLYDLIRFGEAENVMRDFAGANGFAFSATDLLLPIPQTEINVSNGLLKQNRGYN